MPVWTLNSSAPFLALVGVFASRIAISRPVIKALSTPQLAAALRHENAHRISRDNLKRLLLLLAPRLLPGFHGFDAIERGWARFTEWAADDDAVAGDAHLSLSLAAALVRIARMGGTPQVLPLSTSFWAIAREISARVDRLLNPAPPAAPPSRRPQPCSLLAPLSPPAAPPSCCARDARVRSPPPRTSHQLATAPPVRRLRGA